MDDVKGNYQTFLPVDLVVNEWIDGETGAVIVDERRIDLETSNFHAGCTYRAILCLKKEHLDELNQLCEGGKYYISARVMLNNLRK
jgi:hypothetical protein